MKVKISSVRADEGFNQMPSGEMTIRISANDYLQYELQKFLDQNPEVQIKTCSIFNGLHHSKERSLETTNADVDRDIEKSV